MSDVIIESDPAQSRLEELHDSEWSIWKKRSRGFPGVTMLKKPAIFSKAMLR